MTMKSLRAWRTERLLSTRRLAQLAGASNKTIVQLENGRQTPSFATISKISRVLEVEPQAVTEFARAINRRAGMRVIALPEEQPTAPLRHVCCVSGPGLFPVLTRRLLATERYGVTTTVGVPVTATQLACLRPDLLILDVDAGPELVHALLAQLQLDPPTAGLPVIVTARDRWRIDELMAALGEPRPASLATAPADGALEELLALVSECLAPVPAALA